MLVWVLACIHFSQPKYHNNLRYCQSLHLNRWDYSNVTCYPYALSDNGCDPINSSNCDNDDGIITTTLDIVSEDYQWFDTINPPLIHLLKIDVDGEEGSVVRGASKLLSTKNVRNILVQYKQSADTISMIDTIMNAGYDLELVGNWAGYELGLGVDSINQMDGGNVTMRSEKIVDFCKSITGRNVCRILGFSLRV